MYEADIHKIREEESKARCNGKIQASRAVKDVLDGSIAHSHSLVSCAWHGPACQAAHVRVTAHLSLAAELQALVGMGWVAEWL